MIIIIITIIIDIVAFNGKNKHRFTQKKFLFYMISFRRREKKLDKTFSKTNDIYLDYISIQCEDIRMDSRSA